MGARTLQALDDAIARAMDLITYDDIVGWFRQWEAVRLEVMRWGHAMVRPEPGFVWGPGRRGAQASLGGCLHFAHSDLGGLALFEAANWVGV